ncbi:MAG TPA: VOC family protein [Gemmatimonadaceae bacterium]|nr:VOC family protein [Gemmatimonadaceae bacterium]
MHGQFAWYDLVTTDVAAAKKFYPPVTGWGTMPWADGAYTMWAANNQPLGGIAPISAEQSAQGIPSHWLAYVAVGDVDSSARAATALGGQVLHGPEDIPDVGRFAIIRDPQGGMVAIFRSSNATDGGWDGTPKTGHFSWHELMTTDIDGALRFYKGLFGWDKIEEMDMSPGERYLEYGLNGKMFGGIYKRRPEHGDMPTSWTFYVNVPDLDASVKAVKRQGGNVVMGPMEVPGGDRVAVCMDSQGASFALHQRKAARAAGARKSAKKATAKKASAKKASAKKAGPRKAGARKAKKTAGPSSRRTAKRSPRAASKRATKKKSGARRTAPKPRSRSRGRR